MSKKRKKASVDSLKKMLSPTKEFDLINPDDPEDIQYVTVRKLSPGHLLEINNTTLIRAYKEAEKRSSNNEPKNANRSKEELEIEGFEKIINEVKYSAEIASMAIIDSETEERILTKEQCMQLLLPQWNQEIARWALGGARPIKEGDEADDTDRFPKKSKQQETSPVEEHTT